MGTQPLEHEAGDSWDPYPRHYGLVIPSGILFTAQSRYATGPAVMERAVELSRRHVQGVERKIHILQNARKVTVAGGDAGGMRARAH